jgi:hypothetical protein
MVEEIHPFLEYLILILRPEDFGNVSRTGKAPDCCHAEAALFMFAALC